MTAVMDLAIHQRNEPVVLADIAARQGIPQAYLGRLFALLNRGGLVQGLRGPGGGYVLARDPKNISLSDILEAVDENIETMRCGGRTNCQAMQECLSHGVWRTLSDRIREVLADISLADAISGASVSRVTMRQIEDLGRARMQAGEEDHESKTAHLS